MNGLGQFLASKDMARRPAETVRLLQRCGARWAAVLVESVDGRRQPLERVAHVVDAIRAAGIEVHLYSFPALARRIAAAAYLSEAAAHVSVSRLMLDLEPYRGAHWHEREVREVVEIVQPSATEFSITLFTSEDWRDVAWEEVAPGVPVLLQVYERARDPRTLQRAIARWSGRTVVPCAGTYLGASERLEGDVENCTPYAQRAGALGVWALATTDAKEADVLRRWAEQTFGS